MIRVRWIALSFVMRQRCFPHIGMFSFLHRECINLHEGRLRNKMHLLKDFDQSQEDFTDRISLLFKLRPDFVYGRWLESKDEYMYRFMKFC